MNELNLKMTHERSHIISQGQELLKVDIEARPIANVLSLINEHLKSQNNRIEILEEAIKTFLAKSDYETSYTAMIKRISITEDRMAQALSRVSNLSTDVQAIEPRITKSFEDQVSNILVTTTTKLKNITQSFDSQIDLINTQLAKVKDTIANLENDNKKVDLTVFGKFIKQNTIDIENLNKSLADLKFKCQIKRRESIEDDSHIDTSRLNMKITDNESLLNQVNQQKQVLLDLVDEVNVIKEKIDMPPIPPPQIIETKTIIETKNESPKSKIQMLNEVYTSNNNLNTVQLETELSKLENDFDNHQSKVVAAMNAIQFELQQIRDHGEGLKGLPPLNLANVVPSFFNNPSFTFSRVEEEEDSSELDDSQSFDSSVNEGKVSDVKISNNKSSTEMIQLNRLRLPSDDEYNYESEITLKERKKRRKARKKNKLPTLKVEEEDNDEDNEYGDEEPAVNHHTVETIVQEADYDKIINDVTKQLDLELIKSKFETFQHQHSEAMSALDRKIDRDYVERLFDKFRVMIHGINNRVKELADLNSDFATRQDFLNLLQIVKNLPKESRPGTAVKKGPECLFCGKPKAGVTGSIPLNVAASAGKPPIRSVLGDGSNVEYVYGEGQAFRRDDASFQSFPHFDALPSLSKRVSFNLSNPGHAATQNVTSTNNSSTQNSTLSSSMK